MFHSLSRITRMMSSELYVPTKEMGGGSGLKYAASTIIYLGKKKKKMEKKSSETLSKRRLTSHV